MSLRRGAADRPARPRPRRESPVFSGAEGMLEQPACDELLGRLHHMLPHLERSPLLIEKCESLLPAHRTAPLVAQAYQVRKRDFGDHSFSVFLVDHGLDPHWFIALQGIPEATLGTQLPLIARGECNPETWNALTSNNSPSKSPGGESCFAASSASVRDARRLPPCLRSVPMRLSKRR